MSQIVTQVVITDANASAADLAIRYSSPGSPQQQTVKLTNYLMGLALRARDGKYTMQIQNGNGVKASGTVTCATVSAADTVTVGNVVFTAVSGTPSGNQFKQGVSDTADGLSLATAINAATALTGVVTALNASGVVTITASTAGIAGNGLQLSSSNNTRLAVVAMASGVNDTGTINTFHLGL